MSAVRHPRYESILRARCCMRTVAQLAVLRCWSRLLCLAVHCDALSTWMTFVFQMLLEHRMQGMPRVAGQLPTLWWKVANA